MGGGNFFHTGNNKHLTAHDENDMHRSQPDQPQFPALVNSDGEPGDEDSAEPADGIEVVILDADCNQSKSIKAAERERM